MKCQILYRNFIHQEMWTMLAVENINTLTHARVCKPTIKTVLHCKKENKRNVAQHFTYKSTAFNEHATNGFLVHTRTPLLRETIYVSRQYCLYSSLYLNNSLLTSSNYFNNNFNYFWPLLNTYVSYPNFRPLLRAQLHTSFTYSYFNTLYIIMKELPRASRLSHLLPLNIYDMWYYKYWTKALINIKYTSTFYCSTLHQYGRHGGRW
jgi:hypothetical protein